MIALIMAFTIPPIILGSLRLESLEKVVGLASAFLMFILFIVWC